VLLGRNAIAQREPVLDDRDADWGAIAEVIERASGLDPSAPVTPGPADPRWAVGAALEDAGLHAASVDVYRSMISDAGDDPLELYRIARRLDEEGRTAVAARAATALLYRLPATALPPDGLYRVAYPLAYGDLITGAAEEEDLPPLLLLALVRQESFYDPQAGSPAGALGLTQVIEPTGRAIAGQLGVTAFSASDLYRPKVSLRFGASYLADQLAAFDGNAYHALAAYNGGPGAASAALASAARDADLFVESLEFDETKAYVRLVMEHYARYRQLYEGLDRPSLPE
jgi:soluble lytic murein transglycosylase